jgi:diguanylate cyclase (GGDEF)-like protein/putative nucleotidyltransferase with HDIG domain
MRYPHLTGNTDAQRQLEALRRLGASLRPEEVLATLCSEAAAATGADSVIAFAGGAEQGMKAVAVHGVSEQLVGLRRGPGEGLCGLAARTGLPAFSNTCDEEALLPATTAGLRGTRAAVSVPLRRRGEEPDGAVTACFNGTRRVGDEETEALEALVELAAPALRNAEDHAAACRAATYDSLTGCLNHAAFETRLREELSRSERDGSALALALVDLDDFKSVNECDGHLAGDAVLRAVGALLRGAVRLHDTVARFGGDEFTLLLPGTGLEDAEPVVNRALSELRRAPVPGGRELGAAAGVAGRRRGDTATDLIERADRALREAKHAPARPTRRISASSAPGADGDVAAARARAPERLAEAVAVGAKLSRLLDPQAIARTTVEELCGHLGYERCVLVRLDEDRHVAVVAGAGAAAGEEGCRWPRDVGAVGRCLRERRPVVVHDASRDPLDDGLADGMRAQLAVPVYSGPEQWGALDLQARAPGAFAGEEAHLVQSVADHLGAALHTAQLYTTLEQTYQGTAEALAAALEARDVYTADHARCIAELAVAVARELGLTSELLRDVRYGAIFHDIGKIAVPDAILNKPAPLTEAERRVVERHPVAGEQILAHVPFLVDVRRIVRHDHERWDGEGYPDGLRGDDIPVGARIVFVVDAYHAMISDRPYRRGMTPEAARRELEANAGTQFDPEVVAAALRVLLRRPA